MIKKFSIIYLLFLYLILTPFNAESSMSPKCFELFDKIKNSQDPLISNYQNYENSTYGFDLDMFLAFDDEGTREWLFKRDENNYPLVGRYTSKSLINKIKYGDKIISINGQELNLLNDDELSDLFLVTENNENVVSNIVFERNGEKFDFDLKIILEYHQDDLIQFYISNISEISQIKSTFKADIYLETSVDYDYETDSLPLGKLIFDTLVYKNEKDEWDWQQCDWIPEEKIIEYNIPDPSHELVFFNAVNINKNTQIKNISIYPWSDKIGDDVDYDYSTVDSYTRGTFEFKNDFDLKTFPFDKQKLIVQIAYENDLDEYLIDYGKDTVKGLEFTAQNIDISGWNIVKHDIKNIVYKGPTGDNYSGIEVSLEIERKTGYYIYKVIIPILLILLVCWSVVWIDAEELESKLTITIVCLLSLIAYNFVIDKELPKLEYLTVLDWIILVSYVYATIPNFLSIITFKLYKKKNKIKINKINYLSKVFGPTSYLVIIFSIIIINVSKYPDTSGKLIAWMS